jgi:hypothetical protein
VWIASPSTLVLAAVLASPTLYQAFMGSGVSVTDAATRYLICVPVAAVMLLLLRSVTRDFGRDRRAAAARRANDKAITADPIDIDKP